MIADLLFGQGYTPDANPELSPLLSDTAPAIDPITEAGDPISGQKAASPSKRRPSLLNEA